MRMLPFCIFVVLIITVLGNESDLTKQFSDGNIHFTANIYKELLKTQSGSFVVSPLSAQIILALTQTGARGNTARELAYGLRLPDDTRTLQKLITAIAPTLQANDSYLLTSANKVYLSDSYSFTEEFKNIAVDVFESDIERINFVASEAAAAEINKWVEEQTHHKIKDLIKKEYLEEDTIVSVLVNALYLEADWVNQFDAVFTKKEPFYPNKYEILDVNMMKTRQFFNYYDSPQLNAEFIEMPCVGDDISMTIVLPREVNGLSHLEAKIDDVLRRPTYKEIDVDLQIPKFKIETTIQFKPILEALGIKQAFTSAADFSGMVQNGISPYITSVVQKSFIEITEKGTVAGAASAVSVGDRSFPHRFIADHPFIYILRHKTSGILFVGKYSSPSKQA